MISRRSFLAGSAAAAFAQGRRPPNVLFVILDDLGSGDLGCYGQKLIRTPNIDRIAAEGMRFTQAYAGGAVCAPSRAVLMTGLHGGHAPVRANAGTIPILDSDVTVAEVLKKAGYATGAFGKWALGDAGSTGAATRQGFDEFFGYLHQTHAHDYYTEFLRDGEKRFDLKGNTASGRKEYTADAIAQRSFEFLDRQRADRPFFLYACYTLPHARFEVPSLEPYAGQPWTEGQKTYAAMVTRADSHVGRLMEILRKKSLDENTLVVVTSDNGAHEGEQKGYSLFRSNGDLRGQKGTLYEGGIRVPFIARRPGHIRPGSASSFPTAFCDVMPTLAELAGTRPPDNIDGLSIAPVLAGGPPPRRELLYWEHQGYDFASGQLRTATLWQAARSGDWKAVRPKPGTPLELYNLRTDPGEKTDLAARQPELVNKFENYLKSARTEPRRHDTGSRQWAT